MENVLDLAKEALDDEEEGIQFYTKMLSACKTEAQKRMVSDALADEKKHAGYMRKIAKGGVDFNRYR